MAIHYLIDVAARIVVLTAQGPTAAADVSEAQQRLRVEPDFDPTFDQLFDFRASTPTDIRTGQVDSLLASAPFAKTSRRAYVVNPGLGFGMGRVAQAVGDNSGIHVQLFEDLETAREWLMRAARE